MAERTAEQFDELVDETCRFLADIARAKRLTSYTELNTVLAQRTGQPAFDFAQAAERSRIALVLRDACLREIEKGGRYMLTSIVTYLGANDAGPGFFALAVELGDKLDRPLRERASKDAKLTFWVEQTQAVFDAYAKRTTRA